MPFFLIGALDYKLELVYVFIKLGCILVCFFNFWILIEGVSSPLFCVKVLCNCVNTETRLNVIMLEINSSCYQVTRAEILLTLSHLSLTLLRLGGGGGGVKVARPTQKINWVVIIFVATVRLHLLNSQIVSREQQTILVELWNPNEEVPQLSPCPPAAASAVLSIIPLFISLKIYFWVKLANNKKTFWQIIKNFLAKK